MRCFIAIDVHGPAQAALAELLSVLRRGPHPVRWCAPQQLHITLRFLGPCADAQIPALCRLIEQASRAGEPFPLRLGNLGCFPARSAARVLWCGVQDAQGACAAWIERASPQLEALGWPPEPRPFTPHVTLGRSRQPRGSVALREWFLAHPDPPPVELWVDEVVLYESRLGPGGATYLPLHRAELGG